MKAHVFTNKGLNVFNLDIINWYFFFQMNKEVYEVYTVEATHKIKIEGKVDVGLAISVITTETANKLMQVGIKPVDTMEVDGINQKKTYPVFHLKMIQENGQIKRKQVLWIEEAMENVFALDF